MPGETPYCNPVDPFDESKGYQCGADSLLAENARLQEREAELEELLFADHEVDEALAARVIKAEAHMGEAWQEYKRLWLRWFEERVERRYAKKREREAKAQSEQRRKALDWYAEQGHWRQDATLGGYRVILSDDLEEESDGRLMGGKRARAAIDISPEEAKEKEAQP